MPSLSRQLANWVAALEYEDLPPDVVDRAKGLTLHGLSSALIGAGTRPGKEALALMQAEEDGGGGVATVLVDGAKLTKGGAAFVNSELIYAGGKWDTFRMLTHPGCNILPTGLLAAELENATGQQYITGIVSAYEVMERMAADFIPTVMARGFHAGPVFGIFGAAIAAAKITGLDAEQIHGAIAQCVNLAAGNLEGGRSGGRSLREGGAVRNALLAVALAKQGMRGGETILEGEAGFYTSYAGNNRGKLSYAFEGPKLTDLDRVGEDLGKRWQFLETLYRIHSVAGFNIAHIDVTAALCRENDIKAEDIDRIEAVVNWFETVYPSPQFPAPVSDNQPKPGSTHYYAAYAAVERGFPLFKQGPAPDDPPAVLELMQRVTIKPSKHQTLFGPRITIYTRDGKRHARKATGREFIWDFDEEVRRIAPIANGIPISPEQYAELTEACRHLEALPAASDLIRLTIPRK
ncbi:MAG TPA: MmgE/PrpD family protein [Dehalococcoidia bacterium]|nr:MmgE/PrpD family protein [Dehalococcoidia bacterium]